ncbi:hypothetical protein SAMN05216410_2797 [Sanguibacter gelidistatuariae]|uniref:DUF559 domain-containing protein n=1 Tax=Sanguibacter gelidistatuariae TaxID=1814289 RepID=A0A1G6RWJ0_9MICO|nr:hypothetical protein [Sanguibacter gelidistatuariae]SDD08938.1 hypothetical protein SAMN05216410_2797 [Sanguibacter gelidistatuariae]
MDVPEGGPFLSRDALARGVSRRVLDSRLFAKPFQGVRVPAGVDLGLAEECAAAQQFLPDVAAFSHVTALRLLGVEIPWRLERDRRIHVVVPRRDFRRPRTGVVAHICTQLRPEVCVVDGLRVTSAAQTWLQLSHGMLIDDLVVLGDAMLRRKDPVTTSEALLVRTEATHKMRGLATCRSAVDLVRPGTDLSMETRARLLLITAGLPCPEVNQPVHSSSGAFLALPDMQYRDLKIAIEYDGDVHRTDPATWRRDVERRQRLEDDGWLIITATADDVLRHPDRFLRRVRAARVARRHLTFR